MAYNKTTFSDGQVLRAEHLNKIENYLANPINSQGANTLAKDIEAAIAAALDDADFGATPEFSVEVNSLTAGSNPTASIQYEASDINKEHPKLVLGIPGGRDGFTPLFTASLKENFTGTTPTAEIKYETYDTKKQFPQLILGIPSGGSGSTYTNKQLLYYDDGAQVIRTGTASTSSVVNYEAMYDLLMESKDFVVVVYNGRAYHPNEITSQQIVFASTWSVDGYIKSHRITLDHNNAVYVSNGEAELAANRVTSDTVADNDKSSKTKYPSMNTMVKYVAAHGGSGGAPTIKIGEVSTADAVDDASAEFVTNEDGELELNLSIPRGYTGLSGANTGAVTAYNKGTRWFSLGTYIADTDPGFGYGKQFRAGGAAYAAHNSAIFNELFNKVHNSSPSTSTINRAILHVPTGDWAFKDPWVLNASTDFMAIVGDAPPNYSYGSANLQFPNLASGQVAITMTSGGLRNVVVSGTKNHYYGITVYRHNLSGFDDNVLNDNIDNRKFYTEYCEDQVITSGTTPKYTDVTGVKVSDNTWLDNVSICYFHTGLHMVTGNCTASMFTVHHCQTGVYVSNDCYLISAKAQQCYDGVVVAGTLCHITDLRGDSIGNHMVTVWNGGCDIQGIDGDYVVKSLIHYGKPNTTPSTQQNVWMGSVTGIRARCCAINWYGSSKEDRFNYDMTGKDTDACSIVSIENGYDWVGGYLQFSKAKPTSIDDRTSFTSYFAPNAELCVPGNSSVKGLIISSNNVDFENGDIDVIKKRNIDIRSNSKSSKIVIINGYSVKRLTKSGSNYYLEDAFSGGSGGSAPAEEKKYELITTYTLSAAGKPVIDTDNLTHVKVAIHLPDKSTTSSAIYMYFNYKNAAGAVSQVMSCYSNPFATANASKIGMVGSAWLDHGQWTGFHSGLGYPYDTRAATVGVPGYLAIFRDSGALPYINQVAIPSNSGELPAGTTITIYGVKA